MTFWYIARWSTSYWGYMDWTNFHFHLNNRRGTIPGSLLICMDTFLLLRKKRILQKDNFLQYLSFRTYYIVSMQSTPLCTLIFFFISNFFSHHRILLVLFSCFVFNIIVSFYLRLVANYQYLASSLFIIRGAHINSQLMLSCSLLYY